MIELYRIYTFDGLVVPIEILEDKIIKCLLFYPETNEVYEKKEYPFKFEDPITGDSDLNRQIIKLLLSEKIKSWIL